MDGGCGWYLAPVGTQALDLRWKGKQGGAALPRLPPFPARARAGTLFCGRGNRPESQLEHSRPSPGSSQGLHSGGSSPVMGATVAVPSDAFSRQASREAGLYRSSEALPEGGLGCLRSCGSSMGSSRPWVLKATSETQPRSLRASTVCTLHARRALSPRLTPGPDSTGGGRDFGLGWPPVLTGRSEVPRNVCFGGASGRGLHCGLRRNVM